MIFTSARSLRCASPRAPRLIKVRTGHSDYHVPLILLIPPGVKTTNATNSCGRLLVPCAHKSASDERTTAIDLRRLMGSLVTRVCGEIVSILANPTDITLGFGRPAGGLLPGAWPASLTYVSHPRGIVEAAPAWQYYLRSSHLTALARRRQEMLQAALNSATSRPGHGGTTDQRAQAERGERPRLLS